MQSDKIQQACMSYINALIAAKNRHTKEEGYWKDRKTNKAYDKMIKAIEEEVDGRFEWWFSIWDLTGTVAHSIWDKDDFQTIEGQFATWVFEYLKALQQQDWVATIPLEYAFRNFPAYSDLGSFAIVNATAGAEKGEEIESLLQRFRNLISTHFNIQFCDKDNLWESYQNLAGHFYRNKTNGYIPGRPQMVLKVGYGDEFVNKDLLTTQAQLRLTLLALCQVIYEQQADSMELISSFATLPLGENMPYGLIALPNVAVGINTKNGYSQVWMVTTETYETMRGRGYNAEAFINIWNDLARPIFDLQQAPGVEQVLKSLNNAIRFVAKCRHPQMGDLSFNAIVAIETLLNTFNPRNTPSDTIALFAARLIGETASERKEIYKQLKSLYRLRGDAVHQSLFSNGNGMHETRRVACELFRKCLKRIVGWCQKQIDDGKACGKIEFNELYYTIMLT